MAITLKNIGGYWFAFGSLIGIALTMLRLYSPAAEFLNIILAFITGIGAAYYFGKQWGALIILLDAHFKSGLKAMVYGSIVGVCTLFFILLVLTIFSFIQIKFLPSIKMGNYFQEIFELFATPFLALFATFIGLVLEPLVLGLSCFGGLLLYLLRHKIFKWLDATARSL